MTTSILKTEAHLHLYGCLKATDLYEIGCDRHLELETRMDWYADEYFKHLGVRPDWRSWWATNTSSQGFDAFKTHFEFTQPSAFEAFQAKFNLLIALNPPDPNNLRLPQKVFASDSSLKSSREYRTFVPHFMGHIEREAYLLGLLTFARDHTGDGYRPLFAFSLFRDHEVTIKMYDWLQGFVEKHPWTAAYITGIDFCASEIGFQPSQKRAFIDQVYRDNKDRKRRWDVLYHVGEMWEHISLMSAARWVVESAQYGARRLGHGMALGVDPSHLRGKQTYESSFDFREHLDWLKKHRAQLSDGGFDDADTRWLEALAQENVQNDIVTWLWSDELCEHAKRFQSAVIPMVKDLDPLIEVCPTSNLRIGQLPSPAMHPLRRFIDAKLRVAVATDDPGIFAINLDDEEKLLKTTFSCSDLELRTFEKESQRALTGLPL